jgi:hypothetical protein
MSATPSRLAAPEGIMKISSSPQTLVRPISPDNEARF